MDWMAVARDLGFPAVVAFIVLFRIEPAMKKLDTSITALTMVVAKSNGMKESEIKAVVKAVAAESKKQRRIFSGIAPKKKVANDD